jgi:hypothetical protein
LSCGHAASGEDTCGIAGFDYPFLSLGGSSVGGDHVDQLILVVDAVPPFRLIVISDELAGDVGDYWSPSGDLTGLVVQAEEGGQFDSDINHPMVRTGPFSFLMVSG